jgi:archaellum component FlaC
VRERVDSIKRDLDKIQKDIDSEVFQEGSKELIQCLEKKEDLEEEVKDLESFFNRTAK